jgi:hypothetical protein
MTRIPTEQSDRFARPRHPSALLRPLNGLKMNPLGDPNAISPREEGRLTSVDYPPITLLYFFHFWVVKIFLGFFFETFVVWKQYLL